MSEMRNLIDKLDRLDERQQWDSLDAVVDQYATSGMTLQDLEAMEQAARDVRETGDGGFLSNLRAAGRSLVSNEYFRVNYVLYHAGEKLGLPGMFGTDGRLRVLDGAQYNAERVRPSDARARNIAVAQARLNILPQRVQTGFGITQGAEGETDRPTQERFWTPTARSLQAHNIADFRGIEPYVDVIDQGELTRVYTRETNVEGLRDRYPDATVMKADGSGPYFTQPAEEPSNAANAAPDDAPRPPPRPADAEDGAEDSDEDQAPVADETQQGSQELGRFANSRQLGIANNPEAVEAIAELKAFLTDIGLSPSAGNQYDNVTAEQVRTFQEAYNAMGNDLDADGDAGPETIIAIQQVQRDLARIRELIASQQNSSVEYKSSISMILESIMTNELKKFIVEDENNIEELQQLLQRYGRFLEKIPEEGRTQSTMYQTIQNARSFVQTSGSASTRSVTSVDTDGADPDAQTTAPTMGANDTSSDAAPTNNTTDDPEIDTANPQGLDQSEINDAPNDAVEPAFSGTFLEITRTYLESGVTPESTRRYGESISLPDDPDEARNVIRILNSLSLQMLRPLAMFYNLPNDLTNPYSSNTTQIQFQIDSSDRAEVYDLFLDIKNRLDDEREIRREEREEAEYQESLPQVTYGGNDITEDIWNFYWRISYLREEDWGAEATALREPWLEMLDSNQTTREQARELYRYVNGIIQVVLGNQRIPEKRDREWGENSIGNSTEARNIIVEWRDSLLEAMSDDNRLTEDQATMVSRIRAMDNSVTRDEGIKVMRLYMNLSSMSIGTNGRINQVLQSIQDNTELRRIEDIFNRWKDSQDRSDYDLLPWINSEWGFGVEDNLERLRELGVEDREFSLLR